MDKSQIINYWDKRAGTFSENKQAELESAHAQKWINEIQHIVPAIKGKRILDIGTGAGFLAILCRQQGAAVTGIDLSTDMIIAAQSNSKKFKQDVNFQVMDAEHLDFKDDTFDVVIARNVTWLLPNTRAAYQEWLRVLKSGGKLINIDADYGKDSFESYQTISSNHAHNTLGQEMLSESETIKQSLAINHLPRPQTDIDILSALGYQHLHLDTSIHQRIYNEEDAFYNPTPIFLISVTKH
ncbi:class I SAM-dependent methyltransferase [Staphylococcus caeli]|uniref:class I SAM-dependent methyltransferase n=1 Tax=Staphylococcus caeli TaxID=2201815 RepID=UPI003F54B39E